MRGKEYLYSDPLEWRWEEGGTVFQRKSPEESQLIKLSRKGMGLGCLGALKSFFPGTVKNVASLTDYKCTVLFLK